VGVEVINAINIDMAVLVFDVEHQRFSHVAMPYDMLNFPATRSAAITAELAFYRDTSAVRDYDNLNEATAFDTVTRNRLKQLAVAWNTTQTAFAPSDNIVTIDSNVP
jgi:hypothetical protein